MKEIQEITKKLNMRTTDLEEKEKNMCYNELHMTSNI